MWHREWESESESESPMDGDRMGSDAQAAVAFMVSYGGLEITKPVSILWQLQRQAAEAGTKLLQVAGPPLPAASCAVTSAQDSLNYECNWRGTSNK